MKSFVLKFFQKCQKKDWKTHKSNCKLSSQKNSSNLSYLPESQSAAAARSNNFPIRLETNFDSNRREVEKLVETYSYLIPDYAMEYKRKYPRNFEHVSKLIDNRRSSIALFGRIEDGQDVFLDEDFDPEIALKRWGVTEKNKTFCESSLFQFSRNKDLKVGDIWDKPYATETDLGESKFTLKFSEILRNSPNQELFFEFDRHYVFFGYVDFSQLLWGSFQTEKEGVLHFHGYDQAEITIARSFLIYEMMKNKKVKDKTILQVWFSTCWDRETKKDFAKFLEIEVPKIGNELLSKHAQNWKRKKGMKVKFAQDAFLKYQKTCDFILLDNLKSESDRLPLARYLFTGCFFTDENEVCGNCTMFPDWNDDWIKVPNFENFFDSIDVLKVCKSLLPSQTSLVELIAEKTAEKLSELRGFIQNQKILCHLTVKTINTNDKAIASEIKELNPYLIDWSNLPDYWHRFDFLDFAENCSGAETVHHFHTINWVQKTFGALYYDFIKNRKALEEKFRANMSALKQAATMIQVQSPDVVKLIRIPSFKLPSNRFTEFSIITLGKHYLAHALTTRNGQVVKHKKGSLQNQFQIFGSCPSTINCTFWFDEQPLPARK